MKPVSPDCRDANHHKCYGLAFDEEADKIAECECDCHSPAVDGAAA